MQNAEDGRQKAKAKAEAEAEAEGNMASSRHVESLFLNSAF
jgi:hypothetical protein